MNEEASEHNIAVTQIRKHQFTTFLVVSVGLALFLVYISLSLYRSSGTMQLDLSRPGFDKAREEATKDSTLFIGFSPEGDISESSLNEFNSLYSGKLKDATAIDAFAGDALSDKTLQINPKN